MVSTKTPKTPKASYADRVLGAFNQIQREHKKHAVHPATLRAQIKKDAYAKKDKLGPNWSHWVGRALSKMGEEGILEPASPNGSVALTSKGKKAIDYARKSTRQAIGASPARNEGGILWKQIVNYSVSKRPRKSTNNAEENVSEDSDTYRTPSRRTSPNKRVRLSLKSPVKKSIHKMTKAELRGELDILQRKDVLRTFEKEMSPLTDLESDDDEEAAHLQEEIRERDEEMNTMRRELFTARKKASAPEVSEGEIQRPTTPKNNVPPSAPLTGNRGALLSRKQLAGIVRTESGSHIPDISRRPTPAPSSPDMDMEYDEREFTSSGDFRPSLDTPSHDNERLLTNAIQTNATQDEESNTSRLQDMNLSNSYKLQHKLELERRDTRITSLTAEINGLQKRVADDALLVDAKVAQLAALEESMSDRINALEALVVERDGNIDVLNAQNNAYKAELTALQDSWRRAEETVTIAEQRLTTSEALMIELQAQRESEGREKDILVKSLDDALRNHEYAQTELEQFHKKYSDIEGANMALQTEKDATINDIFNLKSETDQLKARVNEQAQALVQASADTQAMRERNRELERAITEHQTDVVEKQRYSQQLESQLQDRDQIHVKALDELAALKNSVLEKLSELDEAHARIAALDENLTWARKEQESLGIFLTKAMEDLKSEEATRLQVEQELTTKNRDLQAVQADVHQLRLQNESLVAEVAAKRGIIDRLSDEKANIEGRLAVSDKSITDLQNKLEKDHMESTRAISDLEAALVSKTSDYAAANEELSRIVKDKNRMEVDLTATKSRVSDLDSRLSIESAAQSAAQAGLLAASAENQEMAKVLQTLKEDKRNNERSILTLREGLKHLRDIQTRTIEDLLTN